MKTTAPARNRSAAEILAGARVAVEPVLRSAVDRLPGYLRRVAGYHFGWWDDSGRPIEGAGGKAIRPAFVLTCATATGGSVHDALPSAAAVELVHNFSLLHDDVMDGDVVRRHRPTVWSVFGVGDAILAGDALLTIALDVLAEAGDRPMLRVLTTAVTDLLDGQITDLSFERLSDVSMPECLDMARRKTGALIGCACRLGAVVGGAGPERARRLGDFGVEIGLAYQMVDDMLGIWGVSELTGKPAHSDLTSRKKSVPVVAALGSGTGAGLDLAELYGSDRAIEGDDLTRAVELVEESGGRSWTEVQTDMTVARAISHLRAALPVPGTGEEIVALAKFIARRAG